MHRLTSLYVLIVVALTAAMLTSAIAVQFLLFRQDRLQQLEQIHAGLSLEFTRIIEGQLEHGVALDNAARMLSRIAGLENRSTLISLLAVADPKGERLYYFDDHPSDSYQVPSLRYDDIRRAWQALDPVAGRHQVWSRYDHRMLYIAVPVLGPGSAQQGTFVIGLADPVSLMAFLLETHSPLLTATLLLYLSAIVALLVARFTRTSLEPTLETLQIGDSAPSRAATPRHAGSTLDQAIARAEQALSQLDRVAE